GSLPPRSPGSSTGWRPAGSFAAGASPRTGGAWATRCCGSGPPRSSSSSRGCSPPWSGSAPTTRPPSWRWSSTGRGASPRRSAPRPPSWPNWVATGPRPAARADRRSAPARHGGRLLHPAAQRRVLGVLEAGQLDVAAPPLAEGRRVVEVGAAVEDDVHRHVVRDHLDDPPEVRQSVEGPAPLHGVLRLGEHLTDELVHPLDHRLQVRHDPPHPVVDRGMAVRRL